MFHGYPFGTKGYKVYDLSTKTCFLSRDVVFKESNFSFKHWLSNSKFVPISSCPNMFPSQPIIPDSSSSFPTVEFTPSFSTDLVVPLDEFPDLVHPDSNHSIFLVMFLNPNLMINLLDSPIELGNLLVIFRTITATWLLHMCLPWFHFLNQMLPLLLVIHVFFILLLQHFPTPNFLLPINPLPLH